MNEAYKEYVNAVALAMRDRCAQGHAVRAYVSSEQGNAEDAQEFDVWLMDASMPPSDHVPRFDAKQTPVIRVPLSALRGPGTMRSYMPFLNVFYNTFSDVYVHPRYFYSATIVHVALLDTLFALLHKDGILTMPVPLVAVEHVSERVLQQYVELGLLLAPVTSSGAYRINPHSAYLYMYVFLQTGPYRVPSARDVLAHTLHVVGRLEPAFPLYFYVQDPQSSMLTPASQHDITWKGGYYVRVQRKVVRAPPVEQYEHVAPAYAEVRKRPELPLEPVSEKSSKSTDVSAVKEALSAALRAGKQALKSEEPPKPVKKEETPDEDEARVKKEPDEQSISEYEAGDESMHEPVKGEDAPDEDEARVKKEPDEQSISEDEAGDESMHEPLKGEDAPDEDEEPAEEQVVIPKQKKAEDRVKFFNCVRFKTQEIGQNMSRERLEQICKQLQENGEIEEYNSKTLQTWIDEVGESFNDCVRTHGQTSCENRLSNIGVDAFKNKNA